MALLPVRERVREKASPQSQQQKTADSPQTLEELRRKRRLRSVSRPASTTGEQLTRLPLTPLRREKRRTSFGSQKSAPVKRRQAQHIPNARRVNQQENARVQHELKEMQETHDLRDVDDDVEDIATLYEWQALEHTHRPKSAVWYVALAVGTTAVVAGMLIVGNFIGALTIALLGGFTYYIAQQEPALVRYRIMVDGVALNNTLYHFRDLESFNVVYEPGETKTIIFRSRRKFAPLLHMEIGEADPVDIRDILLEFLPEDQELDEPLVDVIARRLGF